VHFTEKDVVRHPLVQRIVRAYDAYSAPKAGQEATAESSTATLTRQAFETSDRR
jgi:hypothetical protein